MYGLTGTSYRVVNIAIRIENVKLVWIAVQDLLGEDQPIDARQAGFQFISALIDGQYNELGSLRLCTSSLLANISAFFRIMETYNVNPDWKLDVLKALTRGGRDISPFEVTNIFYLINSKRELGTILLQWLNSSETLFITHLLTYCSNLTKYNWGYLEEVSRHKIVKTICLICNNASHVEIVEGCLYFFDVIVSHDIWSIDE